jgi:hypothetical protein
MSGLCGTVAAALMVAKRWEPWMALAMAMAVVRAMVFLLPQLPRHRVVPFAVFSYVGDGSCVAGTLGTVASGVTGRATGRAALGSGTVVSSGGEGSSGVKPGGTSGMVVGFGSILGCTLGTVAVESCCTSSDVVGEFGVGTRLGLPVGVASRRGEHLAQSWKMSEVVLRLQSDYRW